MAKQKYTEKELQIAQLQGKEILFKNDAGKWTNREENGGKFLFFKNYVAANRYKIIEEK